MNKIFKRITASVMAVTTLAVGMVGMSTNAADYGAPVPWIASSVNGGAPGSASQKDNVTVKHRAKGANAYCNYNEHNNDTAVTGYTRFNCKNFTMSEKSITNTGSVVCNPSVGSPIEDIPVKYEITAYTPTSPDIFWSKGKMYARK